MEMNGEIRLQSHGALSVEEEGWIDILRAIAPDRVPKPTLKMVQALRVIIEKEIAISRKVPASFGA